MLMPDEVKKLIPHPDSEVRSRAVEYFAGTPEDDGTILPLVLETAADLHLPVRKWPHDWYKLILRTEVVPQLLQFAPDFALKDGRSKNQLLYLPRMLARLPLADWESVRPALDQAGILNEPLIKRFERRREFALLDEEALYDRVHDYAEAHNDDDSQKFDMTYLDDLAQALGHFENLDETILLNEMTLAGGGASVYRCRRVPPHEIRVAVSG